jgi:hypothetical protein
MTRATAIPLSMNTHRRSVGASGPESRYEKPVVLPQLDDHDPARHAWADARFAADIMAEHSLFFALLMPEELAPVERAQALEFHKHFKDLFERIDAAGPPEANDLKGFTRSVIEPMKPLIEYKARLGEAQRTGQLRSLVWPLFFDHTRDEAERWTRRLELLGNRESDLDRREVVSFWCNIMDEHSRFIAHLLDPDEYELIEKAINTAHVFRDLAGDGLEGTVKALVHEPGTVLGSLNQNPEMDAVMSAAQTILDFKTEATRGIEAARIKSIIDPRLSDHVRREALKFVDELKRAV